MKDFEIREDFILSFCGEEDEVLQKLRRETEITQIHPRMLSGWYQASLLNLIAKVAKAERILELGTFTGYTTICLARALQKSGKIVSIEKNDELEDIIRKYISLANLSNKVELIIGDALIEIPKLDSDFDLVFIDADKRQYANYFELVLPKTKQGGLIIVDNVLWDNKIFKTPADNDYMTQGIISFNNLIKTYDGIEKTILPIRDGLMLIRKL